MNKYPSLYKPTGCIAVDMVGACITHYKKANNKIVGTPERISLSPYYWKMFIEYAKMCGWDTDENCVSWEGLVDIVKGSQLQTKPLEVEFKKVAEA